MRRASRGGGFTLIEVMIALVISALLVGLTLSIFSSMSVAFRTQQSIGELQSMLSAAHDRIALDVRQAGFGLRHGFFIGNDQMLHAPVEVINGTTGFAPDQLRLYYADADVQARVVGFDSTSPTAAFSSFVVDDASGFAIDASTPFTDRMAVISAYHAGTTVTRACVVELEAVTGNQLILNHAGRLGTAGNDQCDEIRAGGTGTYAIMVYRFRARAYRIDPTRRDLAVLQVSRSGGLVDGDWEDLGIGFTDLQLASRWYEPDNLVAEDDGDADPTREWYSAMQQQVLSAPQGPTGAPPYYLASYPNVLARASLMELRVSLVLRTHARVDSTPTARTPALIDSARPNNNSLGDRPAVLLAGVPDASRPTELRGEHVYRYATVGYDLRNLGAGK